MMQTESSRRVYKTLSILGSILVIFPILAPVILGIVMWIPNGKFLFDFLMPAELFLSILVGGVLLMIVSFKKKNYKKLIIASFITSILSLALSQSIAVMTGLASGDIPLAGPSLFVVIFTFSIFWISIITLGVGGIKLIVKNDKINA